MTPKAIPAPILSEAEQRLRAIVTKAPVVFFALDANGIFTLSEGRALQKLGLQPGQVGGQSVFHVYRDHPGILEHVCRALNGEEFSSIDESSGAGFASRPTGCRSAQPTEILPGVLALR